MFGVDAGFAFPAVGDERAAGGRRVVEAGDVVALGVAGGVRRLEVVAEENRAVVGRVRAEHCPSSGSHWNRFDLFTGRKDEIAASHLSGRSFPPAGAELETLGSIVVSEGMARGQRHFDSLEHRFDRLVVGRALVSASEQEAVVAEAFSL